MKKYYLKDGFTEKGPLTIEELKKFKISKSSFVRKEDSKIWEQANDIRELEIIFKGSFRGLKIFSFILLSIIVGALIFVGIYNSNFDSNSASNSLNINEESVPPPPTIDFSVSKHKKKFIKELFKNCNLSGEKKQLVEACNYLNSTVRNKAVSIAGQNEGSYNLGQICDIFDYCTNNWKYVNDPKSDEVVEFSSNTISNGLNGDCDDFAVLVCSMILAIGGEARINYAYGTDGGHAFTEVNIGKTDVLYYISKRYRNVYENEGIWTRKDDQGNNWLNLDWFAKHPGGKYFDYKEGTTFYIIQQYCNDFIK
jgi:hypothetical protein